MILVGKSTETLLKLGISTVRVNPESQRFLSCHDLMIQNGYFKHGDSHTNTPFIIYCVNLYLVSSTHSTQKSISEHAATMFVCTTEKCIISCYY